MEQPRIEVCFSPLSFPLHQAEHQRVVVVDVLRATSAICIAFQYGVKGIIPLESLEEAEAYREKGYLVGAERQGEVVDGFELGNSPFHFMDEDLKGKTIAITTTNGTKAIRAVPDDKELYVGSFLNLSALCEELLKEQKDTLVLCAGWKDRFNLEDTICGGAIVEQLQRSGSFVARHDSSIAAKYLYLSARTNYFGFLRSSSHRRRLKALDLNEDVKYCLTPDLSDRVPVLRDGLIVDPQT